LRRSLRKRRLVALGDAKLEKHSRVFQVARQLFDGADLLLEASSAPRDELRLLLVLPETRRERAPLEVGDLGLQLGNVKGAPLAP
jgi:hypothetical protein